MYEACGGLRVRPPGSNKQSQPDSELPQETSGGLCAGGKKNDQLEQLERYLRKRQPWCSGV